MLKTLGVRKLDALIITHHHLDHLGGVIKILNNFDVKNFYDNGIVNPQSEISKDVEKLILNGILSRQILSATFKTVLCSFFPYLLTKSFSVFSSISPVKSIENSPYCNLKTKLLLFKSFSGKPFLLAGAKNFRG